MENKKEKDYEVAMYRTTFATNYKIWIRNYVNQLQDKLSRRNMQIKDLKKKLKWCREELFQQGIRTDF